MSCRSLSEPWLLITVPLAGSNSTGITSLYVNGTPIVAVDPGGFCLSIFSIGISRFWHFDWTVVDELFANQILLPWTMSHAMLPVCTTLSNTSRYGVVPVPKKLKFDVSGFDAGKLRTVQLPWTLICDGGTGFTKPSMTAGAGAPQSSANARDAAPSRNTAASSQRSVARRRVVREADM